MVDDLRFTLRQLRRNPGFTAAVVLTLALGVGAATTVFSVVYGMLWRPLNVANADRFVQIVQTIRINGEPAHAGLSVAQTIEWSAHATTVSQIGRYSSSPATLTGAGPAVRLNGIRMSPGLFAALAGTPRTGRFFTEEDALSTEPIVVLSARAWSRYFGGAPDLIDRHIVLDAIPHRVIGVTAPGFETGIVPLTATAAPLRTADGAISDTPDIWRPLPPPVMPRAASGFSLFPVFAMLRPGVSLEQVTLAAIGLYGLLSYVVGARTRELGVRMALGADRRRVVGIVLRDAATMVLAGAAVGIAGALMAARLLEALLFEVRPGDPGRLVVAVTVLAGVALVAAFVPARRATRIDPVAALRAE